MPRRQDNEEAAKEQSMSTPLVITIPHQLGRDAAVARLKPVSTLRMRSLGSSSPFSRKLGLKIACTFVWPSWPNRSVGL